MNTFTMIELLVTPRNENIISEFLHSYMNIRFVREDNERCLIVVNGNNMLVGIGYSYNNFLKYLCIHSDYRRMGIGRRIVNKFLESFEIIILEIPLMLYIGKDDSNVDTIMFGSTAMNFYSKYFNLTTVSENLYSISR